MKIQVLKNETYQSTDNLPKKGTDRATGFDVVVTSDPESLVNSMRMVHTNALTTFNTRPILSWQFKKIVNSVTLVTTIWTMTF